MDKFGRDTLEIENKIGKLEKIEWDDLWFQEADNKSVKRVLFIGDSITRGFRPFINSMLNEQNRVADQLATSKSVDNPYFCSLIDYAVSQQPDCDIIHILLGAHGSHINILEYEKGFRKIIEHLVIKYPEKKFLIANYRPFRNSKNLSELSENISLYTERGVIMKNVAEEYAFPFVDLYRVIADRNEIFDLYTSDGVHLKDKGYELLATKVYECIETLF